MWLESFQFDNFIIFLSGMKSKQKLQNTECIYMYVENPQNWDLDFLTNKLLYFIIIGVKVKF